MSIACRRRSFSAGAASLTRQNGRQVWYANTRNRFLRDFSRIYGDETMQTLFTPADSAALFAMI